MPYITSVTYFTLPGAGAEARPIAEERVRALQAAGIEASLSALAWGPDYPSLRIGQRFTTLADCERARASTAAATQQFAARMAPLTRQAPVLALSQSLQRTNQSGPASKWAQWVVLAPALGKSLELRELLVDRGDIYEVMGRRTTLSIQIAGPESGVFVRTFNYASLADLEEWRDRGAADETQAAYTLRLNALLSRPQESTIRETLVPYSVQ